MADETGTQCLRLVSAFLAFEPTNSLISLARECGNGLLTDRVQLFIWEHCISKSVPDSHAPYVNSFVKKLINEVESENGDVLEAFYEHYAAYMTSFKDGNFVKEVARVCKFISFLFPEGSYELPSCPKSKNLRVAMQCSLNMLEGDTGCSVWPSSLFLSEVILSFPDVFANKSCFEVGSGVGLVGMCLAHVKASKILLSDGDLQTLANMKLNLEMNKVEYEMDVPRLISESRHTVSCIHLPWESASESELSNFTPDIILGADVIYDPSCLPHLVRVLATLLRRPKQNSKEGPVAYIASVIRTIDTFNCFLTIADQAKLSVIDVTGKLQPFNFLPYMHSYSRSSVRLFTVKCR